MWTRPRTPRASSTSAPCCVSTRVWPRSRPPCCQLGKPELQTVAQNLADDLRFNEWMIDYDESGAIGRRYRRQDEIGTPLCITVDFDTLEDHAVTIRERDTMAEERVALDKVADYVAARIGEKRTRVPLKPVEMGGEPWPESGVQEAGGLY